MKRKEHIIINILTAWSFILGSVVITALGYAFIQIITGNVHSTASFEF
jgi:hypothetical protein